MALIDEKPADLPSGNDLDNIPDDLLQTPPAYLTFGGTPAPLEEPPAQGDVKTYLVRARCTAEHGPIERKDGELRYTRTMLIQAIWEPGQTPPATDDQPALLGQDGEINEDATPDETGEPEDLEPDFGDSSDEDTDDSGVENPAFSHGTTDDE